MKAIFERRSIRKYTGEPVADHLVTELLKAAMAAPSAGNEQPWEFIVIRERAVLDKIVAVHRYAGMLKEADLAIVVCGDERKRKYDSYWIQDCSAATENILIEAQDLGLGAVWLGVYSDDERVTAIKEILNLPDPVTPLSIVSIGHPAELKDPANRYDESRIHYNQW